MCGIFFSLGMEVDKSRIDMISHRGPDGEGWQTWSTPLGPLNLGHRRLAIIDTSDRAAQPMSIGDGTYHIVYNGEIYNHIELRDELRAKGYVFRTASDTEVLLTAYAEWGEACLDKLMGMFAFAIWDEKRKHVFVARDRFGIKPLYWVRSGTKIALGSEVKQLLDLVGASRRLNLQSAFDFFYEGLQNHTDATFFQGVKQLRRGECFKIELDKWAPNSELKIRRWYSLPEPGSLVLSDKEAADRFYELMESSVRMHLRSDVPVGSCLSGGLDSSTIVCLMRDILNEDHAGDKLHTISACFNEAAVDERKYIAEVNERTSAQSHYVFPTPEQAFQDAERITWHQDEPYGSTSIYAQWSVFKEAKRLGIKVMLDGQGADEQMAGYHGAFGQHTSELWRQWRFFSVLRLVLKRQKLHGVSAKTQLALLLLPMLSPLKLGMIRRVRSQVVQRGWLDSPGFEAIDRSQTAVSKVLRENELGDASTVGGLSKALTDSLNLQMLLHWEDRNSMAHSVESRVPFLDHRLVELNIGLGSKHKIVDAETKVILRRAMKDTLPPAVCNRQDKLGFATPEEQWFKTKLKPNVLAGVQDTLDYFPDLLNSTGTKSMVGDILDGRTPFNVLPWRVVSLGIWAKLFKVTM